jgi:hypothetical protein
MVDVMWNTGLVCEPSGLGVDCLAGRMLIVVEPAGQRLLKSSAVFCSLSLFLAIASALTLPPPLDVTVTIWVS